eukprot:6943034-Alexandrium_andersonii.AAC.1
MEMAHAHNWLTVSGTVAAVSYGVGSLPGDPWGDLVFGMLQARFARQLRGALSREGLQPLISVLGPDPLPDLGTAPAIMPVPETSFIDDMAVPFDGPTPEALVSNLKSIVA